MYDYGVVIFGISYLWHIVTSMYIVVVEYSTIVIGLEFFLRLNVTLM